MMICSTKAKDAVSNLLDRTEDGPGRVHFPDWLPGWWYKELVAEEKDLKGKWKRPSGVDNEAWDLLVYCYALCMSEKLRVNLIDWENPPIWAGPWDSNPLIITPENHKPFENHTNDEYDWESIAGDLG